MGDLMPDGCGLVVDVVEAMLDARSSTPCDHVILIPTRGLSTGIFVHVICGIQSNDIQIRKDFHQLLSRSAFDGVSGAYILGLRFTYNDK